MKTSEKTKKVQSLAKNLIKCQDEVECLLESYYDESWQREYLLSLSDKIDELIPALAKIIGYEVIDESES